MISSVPVISISLMLAVLPACATSDRAVITQSRPKANPSTEHTQPSVPTWFEPNASAVVWTILSTTGSGPSGAAAGAGAVWVTEHRSGNVIRVDPRTDEIVARIPIEGAAGRVESAPTVTSTGIVLCLVDSADLVVSIDPRTNRVRRRNMPCEAIGTGPLGTWVVAHGKLTELDPSTLRTVRTLESPGLPPGGSADLAQSDGSLWVSSVDPPGLYRIDPDAGRILSQWEFRGVSLTLAASDDYVYFTNPGSDVVSVIDVRSNKIVREVKLPGSDEGDPLLTFADNTLWSSTLQGGLAKLDPETLRITASAQLGTQDHVGEVAVGFGHVWFPTYGGDSVLKVHPDLGS